MDTLQACLITIAVLIIGFLLLYNIILFSEIYTKKRYSIRSMFLNFKQKMWMTICLGILFFGLYLSLVYLGSVKLDSRLKLELFFNAYNNPWDYVYYGLLTFVSLSISIYIVRRGIIYLYNKKNRI
jgi:hypothetical protein